MNNQPPKPQGEFDFSASPPAPIVPPTPIVSAVPTPSDPEGKIINFLEHLKEEKRKAVAAEILHRASLLSQHLKEL